MRRIALVGARGSGKTTACVRAAAVARSMGLRVAGIVSPDGPARDSGEASRLVLDLATGETRTLARKGTRGEERCGWLLFPRALEWGAAAACQGAAGADVLIVDEIGWLELRDGRGWTACVDLLRDWSGALAIASVREDWIEEFERRVDATISRFEVIRLTAENRDALPGELVAGAR